MSVRIRRTVVETITLSMAELAEAADMATPTVRRYLESMPVELFVQHHVDSEVLDELFSADDDAEVTYEETF